MKLFQKDELKLLWPFYLEKLLSHLLFFAPAFWVLQFQQNLSLFQIGILFSILSVASFLFEIPTGAFADIYGRKKSVLLGYFIIAFSIGFLSFTTKFLFLAVIFAMWGLGITFISGANDSWVIDNLNFKGKKKLISEFYIKRQSTIGLSLFLSGFFGAFVVGKFGLNIIWIFAGLSFLASGIILCFVEEHKLTKEKKKGFKQILYQSKISIKFALSHQAVLFMILVAFFLVLTDSFAEEIVWQPFLNSLGIPAFAFGFLFSTMNLTIAVSPVFSRVLLKKFEHKKTYLAFILFCSIILSTLVLFVNNSYVGVVILLLFTASTALFAPVRDSYFQKFLPNNMRATITSFVGMIVSLSYMIGSSLAGFVADTITPKYTIVLSGLFTIPALILYLRIKDKKE